MSSDTYLVDVAARRQIFVQRYAGTQTKLLIDWLDRIQKELQKTLETATSDSLIRRIQQQQLLFSNYFVEVSEEIIANNVDFAQSELSAMVSAYNNAATVSFITPAISQVETMLNNMDIVPDPKKTLTIKEALAGFEKSTARDIRRTINDGILLGKTNPQIAKELKELNDTIKPRQAQALTRTITNATSAISKKSIIAENQAFLDGEKWVATLDSRTTFECAGRDGNIYPVGRAPQIPAHWNCRSTLVPVIKKEFRDDSIKGSRFAKGADGKEKVSSKTDFDSWLRKQPKEFQNEYLGPERAKLFRSGGFTMSKFRDETGRVYTLEELKQLEPVAFASV